MFSEPIASFTVTSNHISFAIMKIFYINSIAHRQTTYPFKNRKNSCGQVITVNIGTSYHHSKVL